MAKITKRNARQFRNLEGMTGLAHEQAHFVIEYLKDLDEQRAARACGLHPDKGLSLLRSKNVSQAISRVLSDRLENVLIDSEWLLNELRDNHLLARQSGNISASNKALDQLAKHADVDAYAADKVEHSGEMALSIVVKSYSDVIEGEVVQDRKLHDARDNDAVLQNDAALPCDTVEGGGGQSCDVDAAVSFL